MIEATNTEVKPKESKPGHTIFKSGYYHGATHHQLFINYGYAGHPTFSFVMMRGNSSLIHNTTADEKKSIIRNMLKCLTQQEINVILTELQDGHKT